MRARYVPPQERDRIVKLQKPARHLKNQQRKSKSRQKSRYFSFFRKVTPEGLILFNTTAR
jgi:hypothetical protein